MTTKVIIFDLWNTLVYDPSKETHEKIANLLGFKNRQEFWNYCDKYFFHRKLTFYEFIKEFIKEKNLSKETFDRVEGLWEETRKHVNTFPGVFEILKKLKKKYKLVLLSNTAAKEGIETVQRFGLDKYFDEVIISGQVGLAKPDPKIFQVVLSKMQVNPDEVMIVGDNLEMDIIPARMLGTKGILVDTRKKYLQYKIHQFYVGR